MKIGLLGNRETRQHLTLELGGRVGVLERDSVWNGKLDGTVTR